MQQNKPNIKGKKKTGRPTMYTPQLAKRICASLSRGNTLKRICEQDGMPSRKTVYEWLFDERYSEFGNMYARARVAQADHMFDDMIEISDDGSNDWMTKKFGKEEVEVVNVEAVMRSRLRVDTRKWYISKVLPKVYGDKLDLTSDGERIVGNEIVFVDFTEKDSAKEIEPTETLLIENNGNSNSTTTAENKES